MPDDLLALAERVAVLRLELKAAEAAFHAALGKPGAQRDKPAPGGKKPRKGRKPNGPPITQRVRDFLVDNKRAATFQELRVVAPDQPWGIRKALTKYREAGEVKFDGQAYRWVGKK